MNNYWFVKNLGEATLADDSIDHIKALFLSEYGETGFPDDMAIFIRHESEGRLHCEVKVYFSPAAGILADKMDAMPCSRPSPDSLDLLAGSDKSRSVLFSGKDD